MSQLSIEIHSVDQIPAELDRAVDALDRLAFSGDDDEPGLEWASPDWLALGFLEDELVSQLCLLKREIAVGAERVWVAGVGGVATHPNWQKRGFATQVLRASEAFMRETLKVPFGLLVCAEQTQPVYAACGWQTVAKALIFIQDNQRLPLYTCVMILSLTGQPWPSGEIDLRGLPW